MADIDDAASGTDVDDAVSGTDLDAIARDLADVEAALGRLQSAEYWTDEVTGESLPDDLLTNQPLIRRLPTAE